MRWLHVARWGVVTFSIKEASWYRWNLLAQNEGGFNVGEQQTIVGLLLFFTKLDSQLVLCTGIFSKLLIFLTSQFSLKNHHQAWVPLRKHRITSSSYEHQSRHKYMYNLKRSESFAPGKLQHQLVRPGLVSTNTSTLWWTTTLSSVFKNKPFEFSLMKRKNSRSFCGRGAWIRLKIVSLWSLERISLNFHEVR